MEYSHLITLAGYLLLVGIFFIEKEEQRIKNDINLSNAINRQSSLMTDKTNIHH
jgi:hypothetical protein